MTIATFGLLMFAASGLGAVAGALLGHGLSELAERRSERRRAALPRGPAVAGLGVGRDGGVQG